MRGRKGFTLIELLVVIAIIGILATIVLINLNSARNRAKDAAIKGALSETRAAAEMFYDDATGGNGTYTNVCTSTDVVRISGNITTNGGTFACFSNATSYCTQSSLLGGGFWCADNTGVSQYVAATQCINAGADCTP